MERKVVIVKRERKIVNAYCSNCGGDTIQEFYPDTHLLICTTCNIESTGSDEMLPNGNSRSSFYPLEDY